MEILKLKSIITTAISCLDEFSSMSEMAEQSVNLKTKHRNYPICRPNREKFEELLQGSAGI